MRKFTAALGIAALLSIIPATPALAAGGTVGEDGTCSAPIPNADGTFSSVFVIGTSFSRTTKSGVTNFTCHFDLTDEQAPPKSYKSRDFECFTPAGSTTETRLNASPGGRMVMTCTIRP